MNQSIAKQAFLGILGIALVGILIYQFAGIGGGSGGDRRATGAKEQKQAKSSAVAGMPQPVKFREEEVNIDELLQEIEVVTFQYPQAGRNVMQPVRLEKQLAAEGEDEPSIMNQRLQTIAQKKVTGVIYDPENPLAVVDNEVVGEGHTYPDGTKIVRIERTRVIFEADQARIPVKLEELQAASQPL